MLSEHITPIILSGGQGKRLRSLFPDLQKTVVPVMGRPFAWYLLEQLRGFGFTRAVMALGHRENTVRSVFAGSQGLDLSFCVEQSPLGTGGSARLALSRVTTPYVLVLNGDSYIHTDYREFVAWFWRSKAHAAMLATWVPEVGRYGQVRLGEQGEVLSFEEKGATSGRGCINAGVYLLPRDMLEDMPANAAFSMEYDVLPSLLDGRLRAHAVEALFLDIGVPESYALAEDFFELVRNTPCSKSLSDSL
jgi:D-glycero-alpha-D-manno-heptose 1-phosphate guanylyltransferase